MTALLRSLRSKLKPGPRRAGLTLIELVVVLAILAAVAAIVTPLLPNLLRRAHKAIDATQTSELGKAVQLYQGLYYAYPDNFDLLTDNAAATYPSYLPKDGPTDPPFGGFVGTAPSNLTAAEVKALVKVGVVRVQKLAAGTPDQPTLNPYDGNITTDEVNLSTTATPTTIKFAVIDTSAVPDAFLAAARRDDPTAKFVVFGVGPRCSMVGQVIQDAPTSVPQKSGFTPANTYSRVGVIFKVSGLEVAAADNRAKFVGSVALEDDELEATDKDIVGYYEVAKGTN